MVTEKVNLHARTPFVFVKTDLMRFVRAEVGRSAQRVTEETFGQSSLPTDISLAFFCRFREIVFHRGKRTHH